MTFSSGMSIFSVTSALKPLLLHFSFQHQSSSRLSWDDDAWRVKLIKWGSLPKWDFCLGRKSSVIRMSHFCNIDHHFLEKESFNDSDFTPTVTTFWRWLKLHFWLIYCNFTLCRSCYECDAFYSFIKEDETRAPFMEHLGTYDYEPLF